MGYELSSDGSWAADLGGVHVEFGAGGLERLGAHATGLAALLANRHDPPTLRRALIITDPGLEEAGHVDRAVTSLEAAGLEVAVFDGAHENPTTDDVAAGVEAARRHRPDLLVGLGGGSPLDCTKGINFLLTNGGQMEDYWGVDKATKPMLPSIGIPTTAGTGSEAQRFALISRASDHKKMACGDRKARFRSVVLDPTLLSTVPREVAAVSGMDALSHAVESYVTKRRNPISQLFASGAWRLLEGAFERYLEDPTDAAAQADMALGSHLSGAAIETSMLGLAHSCANPLTAHFGVVHGAAVGLMLPHVVRFNAAAVGGETQIAQLYDELNAVAGLNGHRAGATTVSGAKPNPGADAAASAAGHLGERLEALRTSAGLPARLEQAGVARDRLPQLAREASEQWTAQFNPRTPTTEDLQALYEAAF